MQYILSEEEYKNLVPRYKYAEEREKVEKLNQKVLELASQGKCMKEHGGYCDFCPIAGFKGTGTCTQTKSYSK
jgi:hypothetical protein